MSEINYYVAEFRYTVNPNFFDTKGIKLKKLIEFTTFKRMKTSDTRIDVLNEDEFEFENAFISMNNAGFESKNNCEIKQFKKNLSSTLKVTFSDRTSVLKIIRMGFKIQKFIPFEGTFDELKKLFDTKFYVPSTDLLEKINAEIVDIGFVLDFKSDRDIFYHMECGPFHLDEAKKIFDRTNEKECQTVGLFVMLDCWSKPDKELNFEKTKDRYEELIKCSEEKIDIIKSIILGK